MSIVILTGSAGTEAGAEHRYLVQAFLDRFGDEVSDIITANPPARPIGTRLKRMMKRGNYLERIARARFKGGYGPDANDVALALFEDSVIEHMPGGDRKKTVPSHNGPECEALIAAARPKVIVVYGTEIIRDNIFSLASEVTLNMHTGLSPFYRGDSTLFWPIYYDDKEHLGVTVHKLVAEVDGGDIVYTGKISYSAGDAEADLFAKGVRKGTELYLQAVANALNGTITYQPQNLALGREFRWIHRTVAAERKALDTLERWSQETT